jgi:hypothetical protein
MSPWSPPQSKFDPQQFWDYHRKFVHNLQAPEIANRLAPFTGDHRFLTQAERAARGSRGKLGSADLMFTRTRE